MLSKVRKVWILDIRVVLASIHWENILTMHKGYQTLMITH